VLALRGKKPPSKVNECLFNLAKILLLFSGEKIAKDGG